MKIWDNFLTEDKKCYFRQVGPFKVWIKHQEDEWLVASTIVSNEYEVVNSEIVTNAPDDVSWYRYVLPQKSKKVKFTPVAPKRPIVVRPESPLKIESGAHALFYVLLPLWIQISVGSEKKHLLSDLPTKVLSNTWFGEPHEGELCYYLKTWARRNLDDLTPRPHQVVCPVLIKNTSAHELNFNRLCIRTGFLSVYEGKSWLWTNKVHVQFRGVNQTSKIKYDTLSPDYEHSCRLVGAPRHKPMKEFSIKSFDNFKVYLLG